MLPVSIKNNYGFDVSLKRYRLKATCINKRCHLCKARHFNYGYHMFVSGVSMQGWVFNTSDPQDFLLYKPSPQRISDDHWAVDLRTESHHSQPPYN